MFAKYVMFAVLAVTQANPSALPTPTPQPTRHATSQSTNPAQNPAPQTTTPPQTPIVPSTAPTSVDIKSLPHVTVEPTKKDWADWGYWAFGGLLVVVGVFQVWLLRRSLTVSETQASLMAKQASLAEQQTKLMARQADLMERQAAAFDKSIEVADKTAQAASTSAVAATETVKQIEQATFSELRARVSVVGASRIGKPNPGSYQAEITIRNFGRVTAYRCTCAVALVIRMNNSEAEYPVPRIVGDEPNTPLHPGGEFTIVRHLELGAFLEKQHSDVMAAIQAIYFYGRITYRDGFKNDRFTEFRLKCCGPDYSLSRFAFCAEGNDAD